MSDWSGRGFGGRRSGDRSRSAWTAGALEEVLEHEARYWQHTAAAAELPGGWGHVFKATALLGAEDLEEAGAMSERVPDLVDCLIYQGLPGSQRKHATTPSDRDEPITSRMNWLSTL